MELPFRARGDELLPPGEMTAIRARLRAVAHRHDLTSVIAYAFDHRTRILPFVFADLRMVPAGVRAIGAAMVDSGFPKTRIVLQQWNKNFRPSQMKLDGRIPDIFMVSSMHIHGAEADRLIRDVCRIDPALRPLVIAGGPRMIYEPWHVFSDDPKAPDGADVAVTGEEYVLLQLLETLLSMRGRGEPLRAAFLRARDSGALDHIPGLVYARSSQPEGHAEELIDTGIQRLLSDLDELPQPVLGYELLEPPGRAETLGPTALSARDVRRHNFLTSLVMTIGCKFRCAYCPIPAYNQRKHRVKSGERVADEIEQIYQRYRLTHFFGTDDNFFNDTQRTLEIVEPLARRAGAGHKPFPKVRFYTEATVHDTIRVREHLPMIRQAGLTAVWMGVEDLTGTLVKKGQNESKTLEAFRLLRENGIYPIPMLMHHDSQPLVTWRSKYGLVNQLRTLRKAGALNAQITMLTPAPGSKWYEGTFTSGLVFDRVNNAPMSPHIFDGNYVVASQHPRPWIKQLNILAGYTYFFNPLRMMGALIWSHSGLSLVHAERRPASEMRHYSSWRKLRRAFYLKSRAHILDAGLQVVGMAGLFHSYRRTLGWAMRLFRSKIEFRDRPPISLIPMRSPGGGAASHALPGAAVAAHPQSSTLLPIISESSCSNAA